MTTSTPDTSAPKAAWRSWAKTVHRDASSGEVMAALMAWPPLHGVVASYVAMADEVDPAAIAGLERCRVLVPRVEPDRRLTLHDLQSAHLVEHPYGFLEPDHDSVPVDLDDVDLVLVPGLAFDRRGHRLGRGAGMYDRLLADLPIGVVRVGVGIDAVFVDRLPTESHDHAVDWVVTESGVHRTGQDLSATSLRVVDEAIARGMAPAMVHFPEGTKTSQDAADAVHAELGSIAKSLVFLVDDDPVLVICAGDHRVDIAKLAALFGGRVARPAPLDRVRAVTGYVAGGTPAIGHATDIPVVADASLARYRWVWSAGGTPDTVYPVALDRLIVASGARWADVSERG